MPNIRTANKKHKRAVAAAVVRTKPVDIAADAPAAPVTQAV